MKCIWHNNKPLNIVLVSLIVITFIALPGCIITEDSPAPACIKYIGIPTIGGCFGKSAILELRVQPAVDCIRIEVNNCNGGVLEVTNLCQQPFTLGGIEISPSDHAVLEVRGRQQDGSYTLTRGTSNFSQYIPEKNELITVSGKLGNQEVKVTYIKTKKLCD